MAQIKFWTPEKLEIVKKEYSDGDLKELTSRLNCSIGALQNQAYKLNLKRSTSESWSEQDFITLKKLFPKTENEEIAEKLKKSVSSVRNKAFVLNLKKSSRFWKIGDEKYVIENYGKIPVKDIADHLKKTRWAVINKHRELFGLRKTNQRIIISKIKKK